MKRFFRKFFNKSPFEGAPILTNHWANEAGANSVQRPSCNCLDEQYGKGLDGQGLGIGANPSPSWKELQLHTEVQDTECEAWHRLLELIDIAAKDGRKRFSPGPEMPPEQWAQISVLPPSIAKLKNVEQLILYGSSLVRIPPEIGEMTSLVEFAPYTSYRLHWFPYEITRCHNLRDSTVSTRAIYGNYKYRSPFPRLPQTNPLFTPPNCSVCQGAFGDQGPEQVWVSLPVATDVIPLLVHACSEDCIKQLPTPPKNYVQHPHRGGLGLRQPGGDEFYSL